jgi:hypothetical protein
MTTHPSSLFYRSSIAGIEDDEDFGAEVDADDDEAVLCLAATAFLIDTAVV